MEDIPNEDIRTAKENGLCLVIKIKAKQGARWVFVKEVWSDLRLALKQALELREFQVGILVKTQNGESIYWTTKNPELFNTPVLHHEDVLRLGVGFQNSSEPDSGPKPEQD